jgi:hypothetical protein
MIQLTISEEDKHKIDQERFCCPDPLVCRRLHALHLKGLGKSHQDISGFVGLSLNRLTRLFTAYGKKGLSAVRVLNYTHKRSPLEDHRELLRIFMRRLKISKWPYILKASCM